jgi:hypothetical protein
MIKLGVDRIFVTFGDGRTGWINAAKRLTLEAKRSRLFTHHFNLNLEWLMNQDLQSSLTTWNLRKSGGHRGFGYWVWKPAIVYRLSLLYPKSHIVYVDAGSHIRHRPHEVASLEKTLTRSELHGSLAWNLPQHNELQWTKMEVRELLSPSNESLRSNQVQSGFISLPANNARKKLLRNWRDIAITSNGFFFTDELTFKQDSEFIEHRHDQSVLSLLWKESNLYTEVDLSVPINGNTFGLISSRNNTGLPITTNQKIRQTSRYFDLAYDLLLRRK